MKNKEFYLPLMFAGVLTMIVSIAMLFINVICAGMAFLLGTGIITVFLIYTKKRYDKLDELNNYLSLVCSGNYDLDIADNTEGELSILKNNLYKVIALLKHSNEALAKDKVYLADSLADISHQLKTPLTSMMVIADLLEHEETVEKRREFIDIITAQLEKMRWLILTLLKLSKLDAGTADFAMEPQSAKDILDESLQPFLITLDLRNISLERNTDDFTFRGDRNWSIEAVQNIIKNCIEYTEDGGTISISTASTTIYDEILISDNGAGIDETDLPHIFERFYHGKNVAGDSVGIGLALSKSILNKQNANIEAESVKNEGTRFSLKFYKSIV